MAAGPFEWKQGLLAPKIRVELSDTAISVSTREAAQEIEFKETDSVYYYRMYAAPYIHHLHVTIESIEGESVRFGVAGYGMPTGFDSRECRKATIAFLSHFERANPEAQVYEGARPSLWNTWLFIGVIAATLAFTSFQMLRQASPGDLTTTFVALGITAIALIFLGWRQLRKLNSPKLVSARSMREALELFDESV